MSPRQTPQKLFVIVFSFALLTGLPFSLYAQPTVWPNSVSRANSDPWLVANHDRIRQMRPRLLVLNFVNGLKPEAARQKVDALIAALRESSRYHGYADPQAPVFLDYQVEKLVDLSDPTPPADPLDGNSS